MQQWRCTVQVNYSTYDDAYHAAVESLESGKAYQSLQKLISYNKIPSPCATAKAIAARG